MADLDHWQQPNGFPTLDYFRAVAEALEAAGITLESWHNDEGWDAAFTVDRNLIDPDSGNRPQRGAFLGWRCGEYDDPQHADDFTGEGWFWCPSTDADKPGDYVVKLRELPYLAEPAQVAAAFAAALTADYGLTLTPA